MNRYLGETWLKTAGTPDGYGIIGLVPAIKSGAMTALVSLVNVAGSGALLSAGPMDGTGNVNLSGGAGMSLITSMSGNGTMTIAGDGMVLKLTIGLTGDGGFTISGSGSLALIVPFSGVGSMDLSGVSNLKGFLDLAGEWGGATPLSPEGLANAVWSSLASLYNNPGTMGEKLNGAGSAGNPWTEVLESGLTAAEVMRIILAVQVGKTEITVTSADGVTPVTADVTFKGQDGTTDRVLASMTGSERTTVLVEGN